LLATWAVLIALAAAIHFRSWLGGGLVTLAAGFLWALQLRLLSRQRLTLVLP